MQHQKETEDMQAKIENTKNMLHRSTAALDESRSQVSDLSSRLRETENEMKLLLTNMDKERTSNAKQLDEIQRIISKRQ